MDLISIQDAIDEWKNDFKGYIDALNIPKDDYNGIMEYINELPSAEPDAIPLEWVAKHLEWLDNCDNDFAQLAKVGIRAMVEIWKKEKTQ